MHQVLFIDSYRRYKEGTHTVFEWLVDAARLCNIAVLPKSSAKSNASNKLPLARYAILAGIIAECQEAKIGVSKNLLLVLKSAIGFRKAFRKSYDLEGQHYEAPNKRHAHFVSVLEQIWEVLEPLRVVDAKPASAFKGRDTDDTPANSYDAFDVEDVEDDPAVLSVIKYNGKGHGASKSEKSEA